MCPCGWGLCWPGTLQGRASVLRASMLLRYPDRTWGLHLSLCGTCVHFCFHQPQGLGSSGFTSPAFLLLARSIPVPLPHWDPVKWVPVQSHYTDGETEAPEGGNHWGQRKWLSWDWKLSLQTPRGHHMTSEQTQVFGSHPLCRQCDSPLPCSFCLLHRPWHPEATVAMASSLPSCVASSLSLHHSVPLFLHLLM